MANPEVPEAEYLERYSIWCDCKGSTKKATRKYEEKYSRSISEDTMRRSVKEARKILNVSIDDFTSGPPPPDGYRVKGTSTLYDADGEMKLEWVKLDADQERQAELFREAIKEMAAELPRLPLINGPGHHEKDLCATYLVGDHHFGQLSWHEESGQDYDIKLAEKSLLRAADYLLGSTPPCDYALIPIMGDFFHYDGYEPVTPSAKNQLDTDTRFPKMVRVAIKASRYLIERAAEIHDRVRVIIIPGNHDPATAIFLMECLNNIYEDNPRIEIDTSPGLFHYFNFGKCLIGTYHGHRVKMDKLPLIMATDQADLWGKTDHRYWFIGHVHHDSAKDFPGCKVESLRVLAPADAWATSEGYRPMQGMKAIVFHKKHGEQSRHIVNPGMLK